MSRLDSLIRRLRAQRACLAHAAEMIRAVPGPVLELGFGNGRTYDHLCELFPTRAVVVFERQAPTDPAIRPPGDLLILGDIRDTLPASADRFATGVSLIHSDIGSGDEDSNRQLAAYLASVLPPLLGRGGVIVSDLSLPGIEKYAVATPPDVAPNRYFMYRRI